MLRVGVHVPGLASQFRGILAAGGADANKDKPFRGKGNGGQASDKSNRGRGRIDVNTPVLTPGPLPDTQWIHVGTTKDGNSVLQFDGDPGERIGDVTVKGFFQTTDADASDSWLVGRWDHGNFSTGLPNTLAVNITSTTTFASHFSVNGTNTLGANDSGWTPTPNVTYYFVVQRNAETALVEMGVWRQSDGVRVVNYSELRTPGVLHQNDQTWKMAYSEVRVSEIEVNKKLEFADGLGDVTIPTEAWEIPASHPPVIWGERLYASSAGSNALSLIGGVVDADGDPITITAIDATSSLGVPITVTNLATGAITYDPTTQGLHNVEDTIEFTAQAGGQTVTGISYIRVEPKSTQWRLRVVRTARNAGLSCNELRMFEEVTGGTNLAIGATLNAPGFSNPERLNDGSTSTDGGRGAVTNGTSASGGHTMEYTFSQPRTIRRVEYVGHTSDGWRQDPIWGILEYFSGGAWRKAAHWFPQRFSAADRTRTLTVKYDGSEVVIPKMVWRWRVTDSQGGNKDMGANQLNFKLADGTTRTTGTYNGPLPGPTPNLHYAFDNNNNNSWHDGDAGNLNTYPDGEAIYLMYNQVEDLDRMEVRAVHFDANYSPTAHRIEYFDGDNFVLKKAWTSPANWAANELRSFT